MIAEYSILKIAFDENLGDEISVGMIMSIGDNVWFDYSKEQLHKAKILTDSKKDISTVLRAIKKTIDNISFCENLAEDLFTKPSKFVNLNYLSSTYNNVVRISEPKPVIIQANDVSEFNKFFHELFEEKEHPARIKPVLEEKVIREKLMNPLRGIVHTDVKISEDILPGIYFHTKVEGLGRNGSVYSAKHVDFGYVEKTIDEHYSDYSKLLIYLQLMYGDQKAFILASEPSVGDPKHKIWEFMYNDPRISVKDPEQSDEVVEAFISANAKTFLEELSPEALV